MALLLLSFSVPLPFPALGRGLFQPLPHFCLLASPLSSAFVLSPGRRTRERGQAWSSSPAAIHPALILSCSLPCFPTLATALSPFALELPAPQGGCRPCLLPPPRPPARCCSPCCSAGGWPDGWAVGRPWSQDTCPGLRQNPCPGRRATLVRPSSVPRNPWRPGPGSSPPGQLWTPTSLQVGKLSPVQNRSQGEAGCGGAPRRSQVQPAVKWEEEPHILSSPQ